MLANSCKKDDDNNIGIPVLTTNTVTHITFTKAKSGGNITSDGGTTVITRGVCWSINVNPTIEDNKTEEGRGAGEFTSILSGLTPNTTYYVRAYATNSNGTSYGSTMSFTTLGSSDNEFTDPRDGNVYQTVTIGNQEWMAENLKYLPSVTIPAAGSDTTPYYYVYGYNGNIVDDAKATSNYTTYGVLYNWPAAMAGSASSTTNPSGVQGVCPPGWHLPSDEEWVELLFNTGGNSLAGGNLKAPVLWENPNTGATNEFGFTALPGGGRNSEGFHLLGYFGRWWSSTEASSENALHRDIYYDDTSMFRNVINKNYGFSVRCVRD